VFVQNLTPGGIVVRELLNLESLHLVVEVVFDARDLGMFLRDKSDALVEEEVTETLATSGGVLGAGLLDVAITCNREVRCTVDIHVTAKYVGSQCCGGLSLTFQINGRISSRYWGRVSFGSWQIAYCQMGALPESLTRW
jgi:hypothetical protein